MKGRAASPQTPLAARGGERSPFFSIRSGRRAETFLRTPGGRRRPPQTGAARLSAAVLRPDGRSPTVTTAPNHPGREGRRPPSAVPRAPSPPDALAGSPGFCASTPGAPAQHRRHRHGTGGTGPKCFPDLTVEASLPFRAPFGSWKPGAGPVPRPGGAEAPVEPRRAPRDTGAHRRPGS